MYKRHRSWSAFQPHFAQACGDNGELDTEMDFSTYHGMLKTSTTREESCEKPITTAEIQEALTECMRVKSRGLYGLSDWFGLVQ